MSDSRKAQLTSLDLAIFLNKDVLDVLVAKALADAGMDFDGRMKYGPAVSHSICNETKNSGVANSLYKVQVNHFTANLV